MEEFFGLYDQLPNQTDPFNGKEPLDDQSIASLAKINNATARLARLTGLTRR
jgi:hypothetical protein